MHLFFCGGLNFRSPGELFEESEHPTDSSRFPGQIMQRLRTVVQSVIDRTVDHNGQLNGSSGAARLLIMAGVRADRSTDRLHGGHSRHL